MKIILSIFLVFLTSLSFAQYSVSGKIIDKLGNVINGNSVYLKTVQDSILPIGDFFIDSHFKLNNIKQKSFLLCVSNMSYKDFSIRIDMDDDSINLGNIVLNKLMLEEVKISARKPIKYEHGVMTVPISKTLLSSLADINGIFKRIPTIILKKNEPYIIGKGKALVLLNGQKVPEEVIQSIRPEAIKSIKIIEKPSPRYGADAIVNIITKERMKNIWFSLRSVNKLAKKYRNYSQVSVGINREKWSMGLYYLKNFGKFKEVESYKRILDFDTTSPRYINNDKIKITDFTNTNSCLSTLSFYPSKTWTINSQFYFETSKEDIKDNITNNIGTSSTNFTKFLTTKKQTISKPKPGYAYVATTIDLDTLGSVLELGTHWNLKRNKDDEKTQDFEGGKILEKRSLNKSVYMDSYNFFIHFNKAFSKNSNIEVGSKYKKLSTDTKYIYDAKFENTDYSYKEDLATVYANYSFKIPKVLSVDLGLRIENMKAHGLDNLTNNIEIDSTYTNFIPNVNISKNIVKNLDILLTYRQRINRPSFSDLSSTKDYFDPTTYIIGNPNLKPSYKNSFDLKLRYMQEASIGVSYVYKDNAISRYLAEIELNGFKYTYLSKINIERIDSWKYYCVIPYQTGGFTTANAFGYTQNKYVFGDYSEKLEMMGKTSSNYYIYLYDAYSFCDDKYEISVDYTYNSTFYDEIFKVKPMNILNISISAKFFNKSLYVELAANDLFNAYETKSNSISENLKLATRMNNGALEYSLKLKYSFSSNKKGTRTRMSNEEKYR